MQLSNIIQNICTLEICLNIFVHQNLTNVGLNNLYIRECTTKVCLKGHGLSILSILNDEKVVNISSCPTTLVCDDNCYKPQPM